MRLICIKKRDSAREASCKAIHQGLRDNAAILLMLQGLFTLTRPLQQKTPCWCTNAAPRRPNSSVHDRAHAILSQPPIERLRCYSRRMLEVAVPHCDPPSRCLLAMIRHRRPCFNGAVWTPNSCAADHRTCSVRIRGKRRPNVRQAVSLSD